MRHMQSGQKPIRASRRIAGTPGESRQNAVIFSAIMFPEKPYD
jgi:hypothetical protein